MKLVIDSNIFVSSLDPKDIFHTECYPILEKILTFEIEALCPSLVLVETTCVLRRRTNSEQIAVAIYKNLAQMPAINWLDITLEVAKLASMRGAKTGLRGGDTIVLQVAEQNGIPLLTKDREINRRSPKFLASLGTSDTLGIIVNQCTNLHLRGASLWRFTD